MSARMFSGSLTRSILVWILCAETLCAVALWLDARRMRSENLALQASIHEGGGGTIVTEERQLLAKENQQLQKAIESMPALETQARRLESERSEREAQAEKIWAKKADEIDLAIEAKKRELRETAEWFTEFEKAKTREKAAARLAQKAAEGSGSPAEIARGYAETQDNLQSAALRMKALTELRRKWQKMEKTPENREWFKENMKSTWTELDKAMKRLGGDVDLYQELPVPATEEDYSGIPFLRSILPDLNGRTATVYLDGRVQWSPEAPQMTAR